MQKDKIEEYGIAIIPEMSCYKSAQTLNQAIAKELPGLKNVKNHWHVTLYHAAYNEADLPKIKAALVALNIQKFNLRFVEFDTNADRWIGWKVEKTHELQKLHESVIGLASLYYRRPLDRDRDLYNNSDDSRKKQIDTYGMSGVMSLYNPHVTLFYTYPPDSSVRKIPDIIKNSKYENLICKADKIVIGKLGYNGNIIKVVEKVDLK